MMSQPAIRRSAHSLIELMAAMVTGSILLAGLASVMFIADQVARVPTSSHHRIDAARIAQDLADELRWATAILDLSPTAIEFLVPDRVSDVDNVPERIRYEWSGTPGVPGPLLKTYNGEPDDPSERVIADDIVVFALTSESRLDDPPLIVAGNTIPLGSIARMHVALRTGSHAHSRVETSVPLLNCPEHLAAHWRLDFEPGENPTTLDVNCDNQLDWEMLSGSFNTSNDLSAVGTWKTNNIVQSRPFNDFNGVTTVEACFKGDKIGFRIPADRRSGQFGPLTVQLDAAVDGSRTLTLKSEPDSSEAIHAVPNLANDFVRVRVTIVPVHETVALHVNGVPIGTYVYPRVSNASATDRGVSAGILFGGTGEFDSLDVRVRPLEPGN